MSFGTYGDRLLTKPLLALTIRIVGSSMRLRLLRGSAGERLSDRFGGVGTHPPHRILTTFAVVVVIIRSISSHKRGDGWQGQLV